jgi:hypothetical protein
MLELMPYYSTEKGSRHEGLANPSNVDVRSRSEN